MKICSGTCISKIEWTYVKLLNNLEKNAIFSCTVRPVLRGHL